MGIRASGGHYSSNQQLLVIKFLEAEALWTSIENRLFMEIECWYAHDFGNLWYCTSMWKDILLLMK